MPKCKRKIEHIAFLKTLASLSTEKQKSIIQFLDQDGVNLICECISNLIFSDLGLRRAVKKRLKGKIFGKEKLLKFLSKKSNRVSTRKKKLIQTGGALGTILGIAIPILADLIIGAATKGK